MDVEYLREYLTVAGELNFTRAARLLNTTQSTLSKHIAALEREFGCELLLRTGKGVELTRAGTVLFRRAQTVVNEYDGAKAELKRLAKTINVQVGGMLSNGEVISILSNVTVLIKQMEKAEVRFTTNPAEPFLQSLERGVLDVALRHRSEDQVDATRFYRQTLVRTPFIAVVEKDHPLSGRQSVTLSELAEFPFVQLISSYSTAGWRVISTACEKCGFTPRRYPVVVNSMVDALTEPLGDAVLIMSSSYFSGETLPYGNLHSMRVEDPNALFELCAYVRAGDEGRLSSFLELLAAASEQVQDTLDRPVTTSTKPFQTRCRRLAGLHDLNASETEALISFAKGRSIDRIAAEMGLTRIMVGDLLASVYQKVGVRDKQDLLDAIESVRL